MSDKNEIPLEVLIESSIASAKMLAEGATSKLPSNITSAKGVAEHLEKQRELSKRAAEAHSDLKKSNARHLADLASKLGDDRKSNARKIAELMDETAPGNPVGIALALEIKIRDQQEKIARLDERLDAADKHLEMAFSIDRDQHEDYAQDTARLNRAIQDAHERLAESVPFSVFPENGVLLHDALLNDVDDFVHDPAAASDFRDALDAISWKESTELRQAVDELKRLTEARDGVEKMYQGHLQHWPRMLQEAKDNRNRAKEAYDTAIGEMHVLVASRAAETHQAEPVEKIDKAKTGNVVNVSGSASIGVTAEAEAEVIKLQEENRQFDKALEKSSLSWIDRNQAANENFERASYEADQNRAMAEAWRERQNLPYAPVLEKFKEIREARKSKTAQHELAVKTLNEKFDRMAGHVYGIKLADRHAREMLALRVGIIADRGPIDAKIMDRGDTQGNAVLCFLPGYGKWAVLGLVVGTHEEFKIQTVMSEISNWTWFEENTPGVPPNVKNLRGKTLPEFAAFHKQIVEHIDSVNPEAEKKASA